MIEFTQPERNALNKLSIQWMGFAFSNALFLFGVYALLNAGDPPTGAIRWLLLAAGISNVFLWKVRRWLPLNQRIEEGGLLSSLGAGNFVTIVRGILIAALAGFLFSPSPMGGILAWIPGILYTLAVCADLLDGFLARRASQRTRLGERLDLFLDGFGILFASILLVQYGRAPLWYLLVGFARYLFLTGIWLRKRYGKPVYELPPNQVRRPLAGIQMSFLAVALWPVFASPAIVVAAALFGFPFLANFTLDWFAVSGMILAGDFSSQQKDPET